MRKPSIILTTFNARYSHASLGLRYLMANMGKLQPVTDLVEFTLALTAEDAAERLLAANPQIIGFGVYLWNTELTLATVRILKAVAPDIKIVVGGPEVSYECEQQALCKVADYVITGAADKRFAELCNEILSGEAPETSVLSSLPFALDDLQSPYPFYSDDDLKNRIIYVEASRGCPFKCEFCLSSLDKTAVAFELDEFLAQMQALYQRGARHFKFVDRTFNLKVDSCIRILDFFIELQADDLFLHFELIPDRLPEKLKQKIAAFPAAQLQFEIGIQSFNPEVQALISRRQNMRKTIDNLQWLRNETQVHIHADLIFGLPGESLQSFAAGFDQLVSLGPHEIQVGLLKRLRGTPIERHTQQWQMAYQQQPPYRILCNSLLDYNTVQRLARFARYWDLTANSGRFSNTLPHLLGASPFDSFIKFCDWLYDQTGQTHRIALPRLFNLVATWTAIVDAGNRSEDAQQETAKALARDCEQAGYNQSLLQPHNGFIEQSKHTLKENNHTGDKILPITAHSHPATTNHKAPHSKRQSRHADLP